MKSLYSTILVMIFFFFIVSCQRPDSEHKNKPNASEIVDHKLDLEGYQWLIEKSNISDSSYLDTFKKYFDKNITASKYDIAADYISIFGKALSNVMKLDTNFIQLAEEFYNKYDKNLSPSSKSFVSYYLGQQYKYSNNIEQSNKWLKNAVDQKTTSNIHKQIQGFSYFSLGQNFSNQRDFELTEKYLVNALDIFSDVGDIKNQGTVYLLMHNNYMQSSLYDEAEDMLSKGLDIAKAQESVYLVFSAYSLFIHLHVAQDDTVKVLNYIDTLNNYAKNHEKDIIDYHKAILNQYLAYKFTTIGLQDSALHYLKIAKDLTQIVPHPDVIMRTLFQEVLYSNKFKVPLSNPAEVEDFYTQLSQDEIPNRQLMVQMARALYIYYQQQGDYKKANKYALLLVDDVTQLSKERLKGQLFQLEKKFETEKKEKIILQQYHVIDQRNNLLILLVSAIILVLAAFIIYLIWNKNKSLVKEKNLIQSFTSQLLNKIEEERKRIASDLHDSVSNELVSLKFSLENTNTQLKFKVDNILEEVRNISRNLSPTLFDKLGLEHSIEQLSDRVQNQYSFLLTSEIQYSNTLTTEVELQVYRIIQEAITNMLKHADAMAGKITITEDDKYVYVEIKDNGKGFDVQKTNENGKSFGLLNITERAKYINGTVKINSNNSGTIIDIVIPQK